MAADLPPEGWGVPSRTGARVAVAVPVFLLAMLALAAWFYDTRLRPARMRPVTPFPAPGIESYVHPGQGDPDVPVARPVPDPHIAAAARAVAREGLAGWPAATAR